MCYNGYIIQYSHYFFMKLKFIINKKYDKAMVHESGMGKKWENILDEQYRTCLKYLVDAQKMYQESWDEINDTFSDYVKRETEYDWFYEIYECVVSFVHPGISNWGFENKIVRWWRENPFYQRRITAHELILSHYFEIYRHNYSDEGLDDKQVWALAEIAAFALTSSSLSIKKFWPWDHSGYYYEHNYPEIIPLQKKLKQPFLKKRSFDEYIKKGIVLVKNKSLFPQNA